MRLPLSRCIQRFPLLLLLSILTVIPATAQYRVTASIIDPEGQPEEYATYRIYAVPDTVRPIMGDVTTADGLLDVSLPEAGNYRLSIAAAMRLPVSVEFTVSESAPVAALGIINTQFAGEQLNEITVTAQRPLVTKEIDRIGYDVAADADASTSNLRDIMRKVPLVTVEDDGSIKVNGSSDFKIYRNGRPNNAFTKNAKDIFAAIPANTIKKIEVITDPGAREDAESSGVILNIVTTSTVSMSGVTGNVSLNVDSYGSVQPNAFIMTQVGKLTMSGSGGYYSFNRRQAEGETETENIYTGTGAVYRNATKYSASGNGGWFNVEGSLELDTLNLLTTSLSGYVGRHSMTNAGTMSMFTAVGAPVYSASMSSFYPKNGYTDIDFNFDYQRSTRRKGETITLSYRLSHTNQKQVQNTEYTDMVNAPFDYTGTVSDFDMRFFEHTFQADWGRTFADRFKFDTGAKYILRSSHSLNHQTLVGLEDTENEFEHRYHIFGIYGDLRGTFGKFTARAGIRYEYSRLSADFIKGPGEDFHSDLNDVVPNASIQWTASQSSTWKASYSRRIQRPGISYLNPAVTVSPTSVSFGNPDLESTGLNSVLLNYSLIKRKVNLDLTATYNLSNNGTGSLQWTDNDNITYSTYANLMHNRSFSFSAFVQWQITEKTSFMLNGNVIWSKYSLDTGTGHAELARVCGYYYARVSQRLPWDLNLSLSTNWFSGFIGSPYSYYVSPARNMGYSVQLKRSFLKSKTLDVSITASNIGLPDRISKSYSVNGGFDGLAIQSNLHRSSVSVGISWRFGNLRAQVKKAANTIRNDDLDGRKNAQ